VFVIVLEKYMKSFHANAIATLFGALLLVPSLSQAEIDPDLTSLREEIAQMKQAYEQRINALELRLVQAEARAAAGPATAHQVVAQQNPTAATQSNSFNPEVSMILAGSYNNLKQDPNAYRITGFIPTLGDVGPGKRGFSLGESELTISANVDPDWRGVAIASLAPSGGVNMENAYFQRIGLGHGLSFKGGRFFSGIGYMNEQHAHAWDFADTPLVYKAFLGNQLADDGLQLKWLAPTDTFLEFGAEAGRGRTFPGADNNKNGVSQAALFAHLGDDVGVSNAWRIGVSLLSGTPNERGYTDADRTGTMVSNSFSGKSRLWIADGIWKWAPDGNATVTNFKLQGEYFRRREDGQLASDTGLCSGACADSYNSSQSGWYVQGVYQFMPHWRFGLRHDALTYGTVNIGLISSGVLTAADFPVLVAHDPRRETAMLDYSPSEFTRFRLQWAHDNSGVGVADNQIFLQYIFNLGTHGAHQF
jgi:hypothetical protein